MAEYHPLGTYYLRVKPVKENVFKALVTRNVKCSVQFYTDLSNIILNQNVVQEYKVPSGSIFYFQYYSYNTMEGAKVTMNVRSGFPEMIFSLTDIDVQLEDEIIYAEEIFGTNS